MINLGAALESSVAASLGLDPATYDPESMTIDLINSAGPTTVRFTKHYALDTPTLQGLIRATLPA
jgi:hypothetical protein